MFKKATKKKLKLKLAITGPTGSGKTMGGLLLSKGLKKDCKVAYIDTENSSASLYSDKFNFDVMDINPPFEHDKFINGIKAAVDGGYDVVVIDSASHFWEGVLEYKSKLDARGGNSFSNWNEAGNKFKGILEAVLQSDIHVICCLRSKMDYVLEEQTRNGRKIQVPKKVGLAPIMRDGIEYEFTTIFDVDLSHHATANKDRSGIFTDKIFQITEETGKKIAEWLDSGIDPKKEAITELESCESMEDLNTVWQKYGRKFPDLEKVKDKMKETLTKKDGE